MPTAVGASESNPTANPILDYGVCNFVTSRREAKADFLRVAHGINVGRLQAFMCKQWRLPNPGIIVQVTGSAQGFDLPAKLVKPITDGITSVASVAEAWVVTGGLDAGVMALVGSAVARWKHKCEKAPLLGVASWRAVSNNEKLVAACGGKIEYAAEKRNDRVSAGLEPNHTNFLLVDNPHGNSFGGELAVLEKLQAELKRAYGAPTVLVVIQGGEGTLETLVRSLRQGIVAVLAADSGKCASAVSHFVRTGEVQSEWQHRAELFHEIKQLNEAAATKDELTGIFNDEWPLVNLFFLRGRDHIGEAVLTAVMRQSPIEKRLQFAVTWNRADLLEELLASIPAYQSDRRVLMRNTLQHALELERHEMVKACFHHGAPTKEIDLKSLYVKLADPEQCRYPLFYKEYNGAAGSDSQMAPQGAPPSPDGPPTPSFSRGVSRRASVTAQENRDAGVSRQPSAWHRLQLKALGDRVVGAMPVAATLRDRREGPPGYATSGPSPPSSPPEGYQPLGAQYDDADYPYYPPDQAQVVASATYQGSACNSAARRGRPPVRGRAARPALHGAYQPQLNGGGHLQQGEPQYDLHEGDRNHGSAPRHVMRGGDVERRNNGAAIGDGGRMLRPARAPVVGSKAVGARGGGRVALSRTEFVPEYEPVFEHVYSRPSDDDQRRPTERKLAPLTVDMIYPADVQEFLMQVVPGLIGYWQHKVSSKNRKRELAVTRDRKSIEEAERQIKLGIRALDLYIWAVLLGNTELARVLLSASEEPMRGAILGSRICKHMAEALPIEANTIMADATSHERFAVELLDLCPNAPAATTMLLTPSRHWERNVLQLAVYSGMKHFVAHRHCQNLCDRSNFGDVELDVDDPSDACYAMLPARFSREPATSDPWIILMHAMLPLNGCLISIRRAPKCPRHRQLTCLDFYKIPYVKKVLRMACYHLYAALFAFVVIAQKWSVLARVTFFGLDMTWALAIWTVALALDEWNQWVVNPNTFEVDMWNQYDYINLGSTFFALFLRLGPLSSDVLSDLLASLIAFVLGFFPAADGRGVFNAAGNGMLGLGRSLRDEQDGGILGFGQDTSAGDIVVPLSPDATRVREWVSLDGMEHGILAAINVMVWIRVLQHYSTQQGVGVLIIMIIEMLKDMQLWMVLSTIFLIAFAITFASIAEHATSPFQALASPVWAMYGELDLETVEMTSGKLGQATLWIYTLISNVLLVNLLIAMMGDTYSRVKEEADIEWKFGRVGSVLEAIERTYACPPPFSLPFLGTRFVWWAICELCRKCGLGGVGCVGAGKPSSHDFAAGLVDADGDGDPDEDPDWKLGGRLHERKRERERVAKVALQNHRRFEEEKADASMDGRARRIETLVEELLVFSEENERGIQDLREELHALRTPGKKGAVGAGGSGRILQMNQAVCEQSPYHPTRGISPGKQPPKHQPSPGARTPRSTPPLPLGATEQADEERMQCL